jgi:hypothetical protein
MTFGEEIDQLIVRTKQAQYREREARHKLDGLLREIFLAFDHLFSLEGYLCDRRYYVGDYTVERGYDHDGELTKLS